MSTDYGNFCRFCFLICVIYAICGSSFAQSSTPPKRKKIKDFGSSLKRLKWDPEKNRVVEVKGPGSELEEGDVIRIDTSLVSGELLVLDERGNNVSGLTAEDFSITEDGAPQTVSHFLKGDNVDVPRSIVLIIDYSGSQYRYLKKSVKAAKVLVDKLGPKDLMAIVTDDVELIVDFTSDKKKLKNKLDSLVQITGVDSVFSSGTERLGRSKQYSALMATLNEAFTEEDIRPIIIFQTDGDEAFFLRNSPGSLTFPKAFKGRLRRQIEKEIAQFSLDDLYRAVERSRATVYTVIPGVKPEESRSDEDPDDMRSALAGVAPLSGGWTEILETPDQADTIYGRIFSDINQRYIIGYYPTNKEQDGKRRKIDFSVKGHPEYQIYGRRSYFAPGP